MGFLGGSVVKNLPAKQEIHIQPLGREDLERKIATPSSILAWEIPWTERLANYSPSGCRRDQHDLAIK